jgi:hypothetical protein
MSDDAAEFERARNRLGEELVYAQAQWDEIQILFGNNEERIAFLNRTANWFFGMTSRALFRDLLVRIARLCDPPKTGQNARMSIEILLRDRRVHLRPELSAELRDQIAELRRKAEPIIEHRHRSIAHLSRAVAVGDVRVELPPVSPALITDVLKDMQRIYNAHGGMIYDSYMFFDFQPMKGANRLLEILELGEAAWRKRAGID